MSSDRLTATEALEAMQTGKISACDLLTQSLDTIAHQEPDVQAWEYLDRAAALKQAQLLDSGYPAGQPAGTLQGIPIAVKDIFATRDMPTGWGTPIHQGAMLGYDAAVVERLQTAGAIIVGKTVTTEYATARPGKTRNPHNFNHTPGGSSSGSAAAVAAGMVPLALGTQTMGSILRPAAYCGVLGFKPSFGSISRYGAMPVCRELDHVGIFAQTVADVQLLCSVLAGPDGRDPDCCGNPSLQRLRLESSDRYAPRLASPRLALWKTPFWHRIEPETQQRFLDCAALIQGVEQADITFIDLPSEFATYYEDTQTLMSIGLAVNHGRDYNAHADQLSAKLREWIERGRQTMAIDYGNIRQRTVEYSVVLTKVFAEYDAILTPVTTAPAPANLEDTGSPILCTLSTLCGLPAISIPAGKTANGLPLAIQMIGQKYGDRTLLQIADWLHTLLQESIC
jgi:Asp-tRNA(Asn)/Glu-tRNA(Gln) amidotransferase A subunit family amidase